MPSHITHEKLATETAETLRSPSDTRLTMPKRSRTRCRREAVLGRAAIGRMTRTGVKRRHNTATTAVVHRAVDLVFFFIFFPERQIVTIIVIIIIVTQPTGPPMVAYPVLCTTYTCTYVYLTLSLRQAHGTSEKRHPEMR